jgi:hypothetical protein
MQRNWISTEWPCDWVWCKNWGNRLCEDGDKDSLTNCSIDGMYALVFKWTENEWLMTVRMIIVNKSWVFTIIGWENLQAHPTKKRVISKLKVKKIFSCFFLCNQIVHWLLPQPDQTVNHEHNLQVMGSLWQQVYFEASTIPNKCILHHDNVPSHTAPSMKENLAPYPKFITVLENPTSLPRFCVTSFSLIWRIVYLKGSHFETTAHI